MHTVSGRDATLLSTIDATGAEMQYLPPQYVCWTRRDRNVEHRRVFHYLICTMGQKINIKINNETFPAELNDSDAAKSIVESLPLSFRMSKWGDEYYGDCGLNFKLDSTAREEMKVGELAYWPPGTAFCIFFGPTPASSGSTPVAASAAIPLGMVTDNIEALKKQGGSITATLEKA